MERINTYEKWLEKEGLPVIKDYSVFDLLATPLKPWARKGGLGAYINLIGSESIIDAYLCEIPPGGSLLPQRHLYEEIIFILSGYGATTVWVEGGAKQTFEWQEGGKRIRIDWRVNSLFVPPDMWFHQHFNTGNEPARYLAIHAEHSYKYKGIGKDTNMFDRKSTKSGGNEIYYEDEDPEIRRLFKEELAKSGAPWRMSKFFPGE